jgi:hypothetical protein
MKTLLTIIFVILALITLPAGTANAKSLAEWLVKPGGSPPVIKHYFAPAELSHGDVWKVYLEVNDPDGDMREIVYSVGGAMVRGVNYVRIKKDDRAGLSGYLEIFTSSPSTALAEWTHLTLSLYIRDKGGNASDKVVFPVALTRGVEQPSPPPPFDTEGLKSLGQIWVKLFLPLGDL